MPGVSVFCSGLYLISHSTRRGASVLYAILFFGCLSSAAIAQTDSPSGVQNEPPPGQSSGAAAEDYWRDPDRRRALPADATQLTLSGNIYYYQGGYFYRKEDDGYLRVEPPLGAELSFLPYGSNGFEVDGQRFFLSGTGTFYRFEPQRRTYVVTTPPYDWRRYYNGDIAGAYEDQLDVDPELELELLRERSGIPRALPPDALDPDGSAGEGIPLYDVEGYRDPRQRPPRPYANVRPPYDWSSGERYDNRALAEAACRRGASAAARSGSSLEDQQLRIYQREYRDCIQRYDRRR